MAHRKADRKRKTAEHEQEKTAPGSGALGASVAIAALAALWALFQWAELRVARTGGDSFCGLGDDGACTQIWDSPFASAVQQISGLPVAGWGLVWAVAALALPLAVLVRRAGARPAGALGAATAWTALAGAAAVMCLTVALLAEGAICTTCLATYALVLGYAAAVWRSGLALQPALPGAGVALVAVGIAFLALLYPGLRTPSAVKPGSLATAAPAANADDAALRSYLQGLPPEARQAIADTLAAHRSKQPLPTREPRWLIGPADAPVRITEFTDTLCGHCAHLHESLAEIRELVPPDAFAIEPRQFPLDGACNSAIETSTPDALRCLAARTLICLEGSPNAFEAAGSLFELQRSLDESSLFALAGAYRPTSELRECVSEPQTEAALQEDIAWAVEHEIRGTPLVLVNGREAPGFPPLLYALILAGGDARHPAFDALPDPKS